VRLWIAAILIAVGASSFLFGQETAGLDISGLIALSLDESAPGDSRRRAFETLIHTFSPDQIAENVHVFSDASDRYLHAIDPGAGMVVQNPFAAQMSGLLGFWSEHWPSPNEVLSGVDKGIQNQLWLRVLCSSNAPIGAFSQALLVVNKRVRGEGPFQNAAREQLTRFLQFSFDPARSWMDEAAGMLPHPENEQKIAHVLDLLDEISRTQGPVFGENVALEAKHLSAMLVKNKVGETVFTRAGDVFARVMALRFVQAAARNPNHEENDAARQQYFRLLKNATVKTLLETAFPGYQSQILDLFLRKPADIPDTVRAAETDFEVELVREGILVNLVHVSRGQSGLARIASGFLDRIASNASHPASGLAREQYSLSRYLPVQSPCGGSLFVVPGWKKNTGR
jgi:hypothetical protein